jgi:hypothetical protein
MKKMRLSYADLKAIVSAFLFGANERRGLLSYQFQL